MNEVTSVVQSVTESSAGAVVPAAGGFLSGIKDTVVGVVRSNPTTATVVGAVVGTVAVGYIGYRIYKACSNKPAPQPAVTVTGDTTTGQVTVTETK